MSYLWPSILHANEVWCLEENEVPVVRSKEQAILNAMFELQLRESCMECSSKPNVCGTTQRAICGVQLK